MRWEQRAIHHARTKRIAVMLATVAALALGVPHDAQAQRRGDRDGFMRYFGDPNEYYTPPAFHGNVKYDGRFTWVRLKYRGYARMSDEGPGWSHDYPRSDTHLMKIMREVTSMRPFMGRGDIMGGNILAMDDPELMKYPVAYLSEPGGWSPNDQEVAGLSTWFQKGGFLIVDDFGGPGHWMNLVQQMQRVLPKAKIVQLDGSHPIFDSFYKIDMNVITRTYYGVPGYFGIFEDNDPKKRLMAIFNYNNDVGEFWEFSDEGFDPIPITNEAYKLGVNYVVYALTH